MRSQLPCSESQVRRVSVRADAPTSPWMGVPFGSGVSYRPGARFDGNAIREASRLLRPYNPAQDASPFALAQVEDGGDIAVNRGAGGPYHPQTLDQDVARALAAPGPSVAVLPAVPRMFAPTYLGG